MNLFNRFTRSLAAFIFLWSSTVFAVQPLEITDVFVQEVAPHDLLTDPHDHLMVLGNNFMNGGVIDLWLGEFDLVVVSQSDIELAAELPLLIGAGSYQLVATTGGGTVREDDFDGVTIGAVGETGLPGINGTDGTNGTNGLDGAPGANGVDGTNGLDGSPGANGSDGAQGVQGEDGVDGGSCSVAQSVGRATVQCDDGSTATVNDGKTSSPRVEWQQSSVLGSGIITNIALCPSGYIAISGGNKLDGLADAHVDLLENRPTDLGDGWQASVRAYRVVWVANVPSAGGVSGTTMGQPSKHFEVDGSALMTTFVACLLQIP